MIAFLLLAAQSGALPAASPLPPPATVEAAVIAPITATLAAMRTGDGAALLANTFAGGGTTSVVDGKATRTSWADVAAGLKPGPAHFEVTTGDPAIEIDGDIAMVWTRYTFRAEGKPPHCGIDHFDLVRDQGRWRILNLTFSGRATGCGQ
jgi:hypothetical protein